MTKTLKKGTTYIVPDHLNYAGETDLYERPEKTRNSLSFKPHVDLSFYQDSTKLSFDQLIHSAPKATLLSSPRVEDFYIKDEVERTINNQNWKKSHQPKYYTLRNEFVGKKLYEFIKETFDEGRLLRVAAVNLPLTEKQHEDYLLATLQKEKWCLAPDTLLFLHLLYWGNLPRGTWHPCTTFVSLGALVPDVHGLHRENHFLAYAKLTDHVGTIQLPTLPFGKKINTQFLSSRHMLSVPESRLVSEKNCLAQKTKALFLIKGKK